MRNDPQTPALGRVLALWSGWVLGPMAWGVHLIASYLLVEPACRAGHRWALHGATLVTTLMALAGVFVAWRHWRGRKAQAGDKKYIRFLALGGVLISAFSVAIILAEGLPNFMLSPCL